MGNDVKAALGRLYENERARLFGMTMPPGAYETPVFGEGSAQPALVLVGEAPGAEEAKMSRPFVGKAGRQLDELLHMAGLKREDIFITNAVKYRPITPTKRGARNRTPGKKEVDAALALLKEEILLLQPRCIATLGNTPLYALLTLAGARKETVGGMHGEGKALSIQDFPFLLYPMYHPASTIYNRALLPICEKDAKRLGDIVNKR